MGAGRGVLAALGLPPLTARQGLGLGGLRRVYGGQQPRALTPEEMAYLQAFCLKGRVNAGDLALAEAALKGNAAALAAAYSRARECDADAPEVPGERVECISGRLGFSSIAVIEMVARAERVDELHAATFNVSRKRVDVLERLHREGRIGRGFIVTSDVKTGRDPYCREACERMGWGFREVRNHAKVILMRTASGFHCVRTSSNLNENPRIETYTWDNDEETYAFYLQLFDALADA